MTRDQVGDAHPGAFAREHSPEAGGQPRRHGPPRGAPGAPPTPVPPSIRRKAPMADSLPSRPGVYVFLGRAREVLYVGTSKDIRSRVRTYFTRGEQRGGCRAL